MQSECKVDVLHGTYRSPTPGQFGLVNTEGCGMALLLLTCPDSPLVGIRAYGVECADPAMGNGKPPMLPGTTQRIHNLSTSPSMGHLFLKAKTRLMTTPPAHLVWGGPNNTEKCLAENKLFLQHEMKATVFPILLPILSPS